MTFPVALAGVFADRVLDYLYHQTIDRQPTDEEIALAGDARRVQAAAAQADADRIASESGGGDE
jgi:hypothetical protein